MDIHGHTVRTVGIEHASDIATEYYASVLLDRSAKQPLVMFSVEGGVDIEEVAEKTPEKPIRHHVDPLAGSPARRPGDRDEAGANADVIDGSPTRWSRCTRCGSTRTAPGGDQSPDRDAGARGPGAGLEGLAGRQRALPPPRTRGCRTAENEDPIERRANEQGVQYVKLDGDIGILGNGAGLVMSTLDVVAQAGGSPANFLTRAAARTRRRSSRPSSLILANDAVKAVLFNIFGGHHPLRRGGQGPDRGLRGHQTLGAVRRPPGRHERHRGPQAAAGGRPAERARGQDDERGRRDGRGAGRGDREGRR